MGFRLTTFGQAARLTTGAEHTCYQRPKPRPTTCGFFAPIDFASMVG